MNMKLQKMLAVGTLGLMSTLTLVGCGSSGQSQASNDTARIMSKEVISTADSSLATDIVSAQAITNTMEGLYRFHGKKLEPAMATKVVRPTNNGLTYTFPLRHNVKWSNGDSVTAQDFVFAWRRTVNPKTKSQYAYIYEGIANAKDITAGKKTVDSLGVKALDKYTLQVSLEKPIPYFSDLMASDFFFPQDPKVVQKWGKKYGTNSKTLVYNGPYKMQNWSSVDNSWTQVKNKDYWNAKSVKVPKLKYQVVKDASTALNLYQAKKLDRVELSGDTSKQMKGSKGYSVLKQNSTVYLEMNQKKYPFFKNQKLRQAMSLSINRQQLTKKVLGSGTSSASSATASNMAFNPKNKKQDFVAATAQTGHTNTRYNLAKAKELWRQGLAETGQKKIKFTLLGDDTDIAKQQSEFLQNQLEKLPGLKVDLNNVPYKTRISRSSSGDFDVVITMWNADFPDPINFLTLFTTGASYNNGKWSDLQYDNLVNQSINRDANNASARWQDMMAAQNILNEQQGVIPLYQNGQSFMTHDRLQHLDYGSNSLYNMVSLRIKK